MVVGDAGNTTGGCKFARPQLQVSYGERRNALATRPAGLPGACAPSCPSEVSPRPGRPAGRRHTGNRPSCRRREIGFVSTRTKRERRSQRFLCCKDTTGPCAEISPCAARVSASRDPRHRKATTRERNHNGCSRPGNKRNRDTGKPQPESATATQESHNRELAFLQPGEKASPRDARQGHSAPRRGGRMATRTLGQHTPCTPCTPPPHLPPVRSRLLGKTPLSLSLTPPQGGSGVQGVQVPCSNPLSPPWRGPPCTCTPTPVHPLCTHPPTAVQLPTPRCVSTSLHVRR
jgi:hypothetical protein